MTEDEWLACAEPVPMLDFLYERRAASDRKLRLFGAACCRRAWHLLDAECRAVVEASERFADGLISVESLLKAVRASRGEQDVEARSAVDHAGVGSYRIATEALASICSRRPGTLRPAGPGRQGGERAAQACLLRCLVGPLPFRPVHLSPSARTPLVLSLATAAYEERVAVGEWRPGWLVLDRARLLVLSDALEEAGADCPELFSHLRGLGGHVRGCWCVDLLLGKA